MTVETINKERSKSNYQVFKFAENGIMFDLKGRIPNKLKAYDKVFPKDLTDKSFIDVGCDFGFWCFEAAHRGARSIVGLDRGRDEHDGSHYDIVTMNQRVTEQFPDKYGKCNFHDINLGKEWMSFGKFDIVMCCSMYHHVYAQCGDHDKIMKWLSDHCSPSSSQHKAGYVIWENPVDLTDGVANKHIPQELKANYTKEKILESANKFFSSVEHIGNAMHVNTREVYKMVGK